MENVRLLDIWCKLTLLFQIPLTFAAALSAYGSVYGNDSPQNMFLEQAHKSLWRQLLSELSKIYDRDATRDKENCSIERLENEYKNSAFVTQTDDDEIIRDMENLRMRYEELFPRTLRNKKLAHYDLAAFFDPIRNEYNFDDVEALVKDTSALLNKVGSTIVGSNILPADIDLFDYDSCVERVKRDLLMLQERQTV